MKKETLELVARIEAGEEVEIGNVKVFSGELGALEYSEDATDYSSKRFWVQAIGCEGCEGFDSAEELENLLDN